MAQLPCSITANDSFHHPTVKDKARALVQGIFPSTCIISMLWQKWALGSAGHPRVNGVRANGLGILPHDARGAIHSCLAGVPFSVFVMGWIARALLEALPREHEDLEARSLASSLPASIRSTRTKHVAFAGDVQ